MLLERLQKTRRKLKRWAANYVADEQSPKPAKLYEGQLRGRRIRLLRLVHGDREAPIECTLEEVSLDSLPPYEALSYVWGDPNVTEPILCNGQELHITVNLAKALRRIRKIDGTPERISLHTWEECADGDGNWSWTTTTRASLLWVDAVSIDQSCIDERNHQVLLMKEIYSRASRVLVWLGDHDPPDQDITRAIAAIKFQQEHKDMNTLEIFEHSMSDRGDPDIWPALSLIFSSQWYDRVWCVQEIVLARDAVLLFPKEQLSVDTTASFALWCTELQTSNLRSDRLRMTVRCHNNMIQLWTRRLGRKSEESPLFILDLFRGLASEDARDNFYGLLGLMPSELEVEVDYNKTVAQVFLDSVPRLIAFDRNLYTLNHVNYYLSFEVSEGFPSWVPRWDLETSIYPMSPTSNSGMSAGRKEAPTIDIEQARSGVLRLKGLLCDSIVSVVKHDIDAGEKDWLECYCEQKWTSIEAVATTLTGGLIGDTGLFVDQINSMHGAQFLSDFRAASPLLFTHSDFSHIRSRSHLDTPPGSASRFQYLMRPELTLHGLFHTKREWIVLGPGCVKSGDIVVVLTGGATPFVLRPADNGKDQYYLMGECYIYDIALGQAYDILGKEGVEERMFDLI